VRRRLAALLATGAAVGVATAVAQERDEVPRPRPAAVSQTPEPDPRPAAASQTPEPDPLPAPGAAIPRAPDRLAVTLTDTTRRLRDAVERWDAAHAVPRDVTYLALHHQRMLRLMTDRRRLGDATLARLPADVRGEARDTVLARRHLAAIPRSPGKLPRVRIARAAPAAELRRHYAEAERRFGVPWSVLAAINFVESAFGRVRSASEAGARGPMQFLPATWRAYGMGGDIDDPRDAILAAANYLRRSGAPGDLDRALFAYNHSTSYVRAIRRFARRMRTDERAFLAYYAWQVYILTPNGSRRITGPGRPTTSRAARAPASGAR
jgi:soluble lytic murein transglycosylase-like protein